MPNSYYYYDDNRQKQGPYSGNAIKDLAKNGVIMPGTTVETVENGIAKSKLAEHIKGLSFPETTPEPVPSESTTSESAQQPVTVEPDLVSPLESTEQGENLSEQKPSDEVIQDSAEHQDTFEPSGGNEMPASAPEPTQDVAERILSELQPILVELNEKVESLTKEVKFLEQLVTKKQEQIDKLYEENQEYKQGIFEKFKKSLVLAVIGQIDAAFKTIEHFGNQEFSEENYRKLLKNYSEIATDFQDTLASCNASRNCSDANCTPRSLCNQISPSTNVARCIAVAFGL